MTSYLGATKAPVLVYIIRYPTWHQQAQLPPSGHLLGSRDSSVVRAPDSRSKGRGFESLLERWENFLLHGQLSVLTLILVSVPPPCYRSST